MGIAGQTQPMLPSRIFKQKLLRFSISEKIGMMQDIIDFANHMNTIQITKDQSEKRVAKIQDQVAKDRVAFRKLLQLRRKYQLTKFKMDEVLAPTIPRVES